MSDTIGRLTLVGTPIGNLSDFSPRAIEALESCDFIAAEDTRVTLKLLNHFGNSKPLVSYHEHNKRESGERICARLLAGEHGVLVSDAGMPAISDPGEDLVALCHQMGIPVGVVPGPTADKLVPKTRTSSLVLYGIYIALTIMMIVLLLLGDMPLFDSVNIAFATAGTGGFAITNNSIAAYDSAYVCVRGRGCGKRKHF